MAARLALMVWCCPLAIRSAAAWSASRSWSSAVIGRPARRPAARQRRSRSQGTGWRGASGGSPASPRGDVLAGVGSLAEDAGSIAALAPAGAALGAGFAAVAAAPAMVLEDFEVVLHVDPAD